MLLETEAFQHFRDLFNNLLVYATRPEVLWQLGLGFVAWLLAVGLLQLVKQIVASRLASWFALRFAQRSTDNFPVAIEQPNEWRNTASVWLSDLCQRAAQPAFTLLILLVVIQIQTRQGLLTGLLTEFVSVTSVHLILQVLIATLYTFGDRHYMRRFTGHFLWPLFVLFIFWRILNRLTSIQTLLQSELVTLFGSPVTVGAALIATVGLYLWIVGATLLDDAAVSILSHRNDEIGSAKATFTLIRYLLIIIGIGIAISQLNFNATTIAAITGGLSVGIGFALSTILSNFISGLILLFERSIQPGDVIEIDESLSIVEDVSMRAMRVRTLNNIEVVIPNQTFVSSSFTTYTGSDKRIRVQLPASASYADAPETVQQVLGDIARNHPLVLLDPAPNVQLVTFGESSIDYLLNVWLASPLDRPKTISDLNVAIYKAFAENGLSIPFPQRDLHLISSAPTDD